MALIVGANEAGGGRVKLRHAETDASRMAQVLVGLGGVAADDVWLRLNPTLTELRRELGRASSRVAVARRSARRVELVFYFSGHSDEEGLLLRDGRLDYAELRRMLESTPVDFQVAVLDSCASGAFTRWKGGALRPPFVVDDSASVRGQAILTSSSANELSQESDRLEGSFFTHHLLSGLRGAADSSGDGKVTLSEAYQYAFHETLARTERTVGGPQHPTYAIEIAGTGDLVLTDLRSGSARLSVPASLRERVSVRDAKGKLIVELGDRRGPVELGLEAGRYEVTVGSAGTARGGSVTLAPRGKVELSEAALRPLGAEYAVARGPSLAARAPFSGRWGASLMAGAGYGEGNLYGSFNLVVEHRWETFLLGVDLTGLGGRQVGSPGRASLTTFAGGKVIAGAAELSGGAGLGATRNWVPVGGPGHPVVISFQLLGGVAFELAPGFDLLTRLSVVLTDRAYGEGTPREFATLMLGPRLRLQGL